MINQFFTNLLVCDGSYDDHGVIMIGVIKKRIFICESDRGSVQGFKALTKLMLLKCFF